MTFQFYLQIALYLTYQNNIVYCSLTGSEDIPGDDLYSVASNPSDFTLMTIECTPEREKHVEKMNPHDR
jgi:hypothetical protein